VKLQPIVASENDYYTKLQLSMRSSRTAPDMCYEDTFLINSDISAGYLTPLDDRLNGWPDWSRFNEEAKGAAQALDGKTYGIPDGTDVRALWFNKKLFAQAGLPETWQPKKLERHHDSCPDDQVQGPGLRQQHPVGRQPAPAGRFGKGEDQAITRSLQPDPARSHIRHRT
jgi:Bacterial extracellular solute-binding protein